MASELHYPGVMSLAGLLEFDPNEDPRERFARVIRVARTQRQWNQEELADHAGVSRPTIQRWENGRAAPDPENARKAFRALGVDPRWIPVVLGYITADEMGLPAAIPRVFTPTTEDAIAILEDPAVSAAAKREWVEFLRFRAQPHQASPPQGDVEQQAG